MYPDTVGTFVYQVKW